ncbi:MAG: hypothetical protein R2849_18705 [Thermomicrobiales bacterium]
MREAVSLAYLGRLHVYLGDDAGSQEYLDQFLHVIDDIDAIRRRLGSVALAVRHYHAGDAEQALVYARRAVITARVGGQSRGPRRCLVVTAQILAGMNRLAEATDAYQRAIALCDGVDSASEAINARAALAQIALERGDESSARAYANLILATLAEHPDGCVDQPGAVYLACYQVLDAIGDPRATEILDKAYHQLLEYANGIVDERRRRSFLENVTAHRELQQAYEELASFE